MKGHYGKYLIVFIDYRLFLLSSVGYIKLSLRTLAYRLKKAISFSIMIQLFLQPSKINVAS